MIFFFYLAEALLPSTLICTAVQSGFFSAWGRGCSRSAASPSNRVSSYFAWKRNEAKLKQKWAKRNSDKKVSFACFALKCYRIFWMRKRNDTKRKILKISLKFDKKLNFCANPIQFFLISCNMFVTLRSIPTIYILYFVATNRLQTSQNA